MTKFNYEILKDTEKAVFAKVPYYEQTCEYTKSNKQLYYECWIPKSILDKGLAKTFVIGKRNELRLSNAYQRRQQMPNSWNTMGEYAPVKQSYTIDVIDYDALAKLISFYESKYGATLRRLIIDGEGTNGYVSDEDETIIKQLEFASISKEFVPKRKQIMYKNI
jgi:hypothetical protein